MTSGIKGRTVTKTIRYMICCLLLIDCVSSQAYAQQPVQDKSLPAAVRSHFLMIEAEARAMEQCSTARVVVP